MSGAARKRGRGRAAATRPGDDASQSSSRRGDRLVPAGGFDGPASRGSASGTGQSGPRRGSNPPSVGSGTPQPAETGAVPQSGSRRSSVSGPPPPQPPPAQSQAPRGDPARDRPSRATDALKNVDLPASFFNVDNLVSPHLFHLFFEYRFTYTTLVPSLPPTMKESLLQ